jgi:hypothetical protein
MRAVALLLLMLCTSCTHVQYGSSMNGASVQVNGGNALGVVLLGGMLATGAVEDFRGPAMDWMWSSPPPAMSPDRPVAEQDCTKPIELTGNLRCR